MRVLIKSICGSVLAATIVLLAGCRQTPQTNIDPLLWNEIQHIRAIDDHAHPVRWVQSGLPDREFDALPVDNMEPSSDPLILRPNAPQVVEAIKELYGSADHKTALMKEKGDAYPAWVLDQMGVDIMLANRVAMGPSIQPPRFRWVPYADALIFPLDNSPLASVNSDRKSFFALEDILRQRYVSDSGLKTLPATLSQYLSQIVTPTLERQKQGGALAEKFEAAYLRSLQFDAVDQSVAEQVYARYMGKKPPTDSDYKSLQDFLFRYIAAECGRLGMAVHIHTMAGAGSYFNVAGASPLMLESVLDDPKLRHTRFVMIHGGWPFTREITALLQKPNAYLDFSAQDLVLSPATLALTIRQWLEWVPEKILFGTDAYPFSDQMGWEESGWIASNTGRRALAIALTAMMRDGEISRDRAAELARMVLRDNARQIYGL
ncbi:MAG: amidohydrolase family protein [Acidobacteriia bacterium]|nr:amidohydrolase family protein [Terriglobia bacterium]